MFATSNSNGARWLAHITLVAVADAAERLLVLSIFSCLAWRLVIPLVQESAIVSLLLLTSEGLVVALLISRRPATRISTNWREWAVSLSATLAPMLVSPNDRPGLLPPVVGASILVMGMVIQVHAKLALGRSFGCVPAHRGLKFSGPYRVVRHPMYAGYLLSHAAFLLMNLTFGNMVVYGATYALQIPRILGEERLLSADPKYREYRRRVRSRLIPGIF